MRFTITRAVSGLRRIGDGFRQFQPAAAMLEFWRLRRRTGWRRKCGGTTSP